MSEFPPPGAECACLTVLVPAAFEAHVVDWLIAHPDWPVEFSVHGVAVRGPSVRLTSVEERVSGFARRSEVKLIVDRTRLEALITAVGGLLDGVTSSYWVVPVERCGTFGGPV